MLSESYPVFRVDNCSLSPGWFGVVQEELANANSAVVSGVLEGISANGTNSWVSFSCLSDGSADFINDLLAARILMKLSCVITEQILGDVNRSFITVMENTVNSLEVRITLH
jgi:hypothetical protein